MVALELRTPRLRVLHVDKLYHRELGVLLFQLRCSPRRIEVDGDLPCVRVLKLYLWSLTVTKPRSSHDSTVLGTSACIYPPSSAW